MRSPAGADLVPAHLLPHLFHDLALDLRHGLGVGRGRGARPAARAADGPRNAAARRHSGQGRGRSDPARRRGRRRHARDRSRPPVSATRSRVCPGADPARPWPSVRFLLPGFLCSSRSQPWRWRARHDQCVTIGVLLAVLVAAAGGIRIVSGVRSAEYASLPDANSVSSGRGDWAGWLETARWLEAGTPRGARVTSHWDPFYFLFGRRAGLRFMPFRPLARPGVEASGAEAREPSASCALSASAGWSWIPVPWISIGAVLPSSPSGARWWPCRRRGPGLPFAAQTAPTRSGSSARRRRHRQRAEGFALLVAGQSPAISPRRRRRSRWATIWRSASGWMPGVNSG